MGNCQAAEAATVVIQHPGNKIQRIYHSLSVDQVMKSNPGHYVALLIPSPNATQLKLLRPHHTLHIGHVYRLITFQDVINHFATNKSPKLAKLLRETNHIRSLRPNPCTVKVEPEVNKMGSYGYGRQNNKGRGSGQWRPALQSIAEIGT
ncbi:hypothetical protein Fmac_002301 [Flemingia macrophylla]|uniref:Uncharacterized protein n=1 Tax=Flemingia macrophylla TaxID=520843 RepID=A0ABD1NK58_9FABA